MAKREPSYSDERGSICGSIGGETFASRRKTNTCSLRTHSVDVLARRLREHQFELEEKSREPIRKRFNNSFHNFRFVVVMLGGFSFGLVLLLRYNITVAILNMVNQTAIYLEEHPNKTVEDFHAKGYISVGEFNWNNEIQHMIMSWYMIAYTLPQLPCTKIGLIIGSRLAIPISLLLCAVSTLLVPPFAYLGWQWIIALRLINGVGASAVLPLMLNLVENWMPYNEITLGLTFAQVLQATLSATNPLISGYLSAIHWSYAFYWPGIATLIFCLIFVILVSDNPEENWLISEKEVGTICSCPKDHQHTNCVKQMDSNSNADTEASKQSSRKATWLDVLKIPAFYAYIVMWCFYCSPYSTFVFILPTYLRQFLKIQIAQTGFYCFVIQIGCIASVIWPHLFLKLAQNKFGCSTIVSRRLTNLLIALMVGSTWIFTGMFHSNQLLMFFLNRCFHGSNDINVTSNFMGNFAKAGLSSIAFSMMNTVGNLSVVFASTFVGYVLDMTGQSVAGWTYIYYGLAGTQVVSLIIYSTMIDSNPIEFKSKSVEASQKVASISANQSAFDVGVDNNDKMYGTLNNFDKLRSIEKEEEKEGT